MLDHIILRNGMSQGEIKVSAKDQDGRSADLSSVTARVRNAAGSVLADDVSLTGSKGQYRLDLSKITSSRGALRCVTCFESELTSHISLRP